MVKRMNRERAAWKAVERRISSERDNYICASIEHVTVYPWFWFLAGRMHRKVANRASGDNYGRYVWRFPGVDERKARLEWIRERIEELR